MPTELGSSQHHDPEHSAARFSRSGTRSSPSAAFKRAVESIEARHKRSRPYRPQTNGKAERFIKTLLAEWAYGQLYRTNAERIDSLPAWVVYYNEERTHTALGGITPMAALANNLHGNHT